MKRNRVYYSYTIFFIILFWINCGPLIGQITPLLEFGYEGEYWDYEKIALSVKIVEDIYVYEFNAFQNNKLIISRKGNADLRSVQEFWNFLKEDSILDLKSASLSEPSKSNADLEVLYKKSGIDHQSSIIYEFYFITNEGKTRFKVDDVKNVSEARYLLVLEKMNSIVKQPSFKTIFEYHEYLNAR